MSWIVFVFYFLAPLAGAIALWRSARPRLGLAYYVASLVVPPFASWLMIELAVLTARPGDIVGMPVLFFAWTFGAFIWIAFMIVGISLARMNQRGAPGQQ